MCIKSGQIRYTWRLIYEQFWSPRAISVRWLKGVKSYWIENMWSPDQSSDQTTGATKYSFFFKQEQENPQFTATYNMNITNHIQLLFLFIKTSLKTQYYLKYTNSNSWWQSSVAKSLTCALYSFFPPKIKMTFQKELSVIAEIYFFLFIYYFLCYQTI